MAEHEHYAIIDQDSGPRTNKKGAEFHQRDVTLLRFFLQHANELHNLRWDFPNTRLVAIRKKKTQMEI
jgi:hypothetical protein